MSSGKKKTRIKVPKFLTSLNLETMAILKESWNSLTKPTSIIPKEGYDNATKSVIIMEPFARGFGNTLGNALRRVLLSSRFKDVKNLGTFIRVFFLPDDIHYEDDKL